MKICELDNMIKAVCPIHGVNSDGVISFKDEATGEQRAAAQKIMEENFSSLSSECSDCLPSPAKILADALVNKGVLTQAEIDTVAAENGVVFSDQ